MSDPMLHPEAVEGSPKPRPAAWRWGLYALGLGLLGVCVWLGLGDVQAGWQKLREADAGVVAAMALTVVGSMLVNGWVFWAVIIPFRPHKPVGLGEMTALIAASSLLNYLPMRAGLIGRAAYLKQQHDLPYRLSVVMMLFVAASTAAVYAWVVLATWAMDGSDYHGLCAEWFVMIGVGLVVLAQCAWLVIRYGRAFVPKSLLHYFDDAQLAIAWFGRRSVLTGVLVLALVLLMRAIDVGFVAARLWLAMQILGQPIEPTHAVMLAAGGMIVTLATPLPNGLGLREFVYGGLSDQMALGLIDRAIEAVVFVVTGVAALLFVHRGTRDPDAGPPGEA